MLDIIWFAPDGCLQSDICKRLSATKQTVSAIIKKFLKLGFVPLTEAENDRRNKIVRLTNIGVKFKNDGASCLTNTRNCHDRRLQVGHNPLNFGLRIFHLLLYVLDLLNEHTELKGKAVAAKCHAERRTGGAAQFSRFVRAELTATQLGLPNCRRISFDVAPKTSEKTLWYSGKT